MCVYIYIYVCVNIYIYICITGPSFRYTNEERSRILDPTHSIFRIIKDFALSKQPEAIISKETNTIFRKMQAEDERQGIIGSMAGAVAVTAFPHFCKPCLALRPQQGRPSVFPPFPFDINRCYRNHTYIRPERKRKGEDREKGQGMAREGRKLTLHRLQLADARTATMG